jgi:F-type H+-transporting ATPase subunit b
MIRVAMRPSVAFAALMLVVAASPLVLADEPASSAHHEATTHQAGHGEGAHEPSISDLLFPAINFSIYLFIVIRFVIPAMREFLRRRHSEAVLAQSEATAALVSAEERMAAARARQASLSAEGETIRRDLVAVADRQAERLAAQAEETGKRRLADAALVAEQERRRALSEVRADIAKMATDIAERRIRERLTPADQRSFIQQFLKDAAHQ